MHLSRKIIRILRRIATNPVLFLCRSPRTAHRIQKTCVLFFSVLPLLLFRVRIHPLPEGISDSLRRALADATPSLSAQNLYLLQHYLHKFLFPAFYHKAFSGELCLGIDRFDILHRLTVNGYTTYDAGGLNKNMMPEK